MPETGPRKGNQWKPQKNALLEGEIAMDFPLVVSFGAGVDSTAMLVEMHNRAITPQLILFADTGGEKPATYEHIKTMTNWCELVGFPTIITVRYVPPRSPYRDLENNCLYNQTLPGLAFGMKSCSIKWKVKPQQTYLKTWMVEHGINEIVNAIGLDASPADLRRKSTYAAKGAGSKFGAFWYPLQEWGLTRAACIEIIKNEGLPVPVKSCCFFCPAMKKNEIAALKDSDPDLYLRALALETNALNGKHQLRSTKGLGRNFAWRDLEGK